MWPIILISRIHKSTDNTHLPASFSPNRPSGYWEMGDREKNSDIRTDLFIWWSKWLVVLIFEIHTSAWCVQPHANSRQNPPIGCWEKTDGRTDSPILMLWFDPCNLDQVFFCFLLLSNLYSFYLSTPSCHSSSKSVNNFLSYWGNSLKQSFLMVISPLWPWPVI